MVDVVFMGRIRNVLPVGAHVLPPARLWGLHGVSGVMCTRARERGAGVGGCGGWSGGGVCCLHAWVKWREECVSAMTCGRLHVHFDHDARSMGLITESDLCRSSMLLCICQVRGSKGDGRHKRKRRYEPSRKSNGGPTFLTPLYSERLRVRACPLTCGYVCCEGAWGCAWRVRGANGLQTPSVLSVMGLTCPYARVRPAMHAHVRVWMLLCGVVRACHAMPGGAGVRCTVRACVGVWGAAVDWSRQAEWIGRR